MANIELIRDRLDLERRSLARDDEVADILPLVTRVVSVDGSRHSIIFSALSTDNAEATIAEQVSYYRALDTEVEWKVYRHDEPPDLLDRLTSHGFETGPCESVLVFDLCDRSDWLVAKSEWPILRIVTSSQVELYRQAEKEIFQRDSDATTNELLRAIRIGSTQHLGYIALENGRAVSIGRLYTHPDSAFGGLYGGGTLASHRGRGLYRAVVAARALDAVELGARYLIVDALPTSQPILERLGFVPFTETWPCVLPRAGGRTQINAEGRGCDSW